MGDSLNINERIFMRNSKAKQIRKKALEDWSKMTNDQKQEWYRLPSRDPNVLVNGFKRYYRNMKKAATR